MSTPPSVIKTKSEIQFTLTEAFEIQSNNQKFNLKISYNEEIILFEISEEGSSFPQNEYSLYQTLNELSKLNKYFRQFDNLQEVYSAFKVLIKSNNLSIIKEEELIKIKITNTITEKEFFINIPMKEKNMQSEINSLISYTKSLTERIENLEN